MVDLSAAPFHLDADAIRWVEETIAGMTDEEMIGQLFVNMGSSRDPDYLCGVLDEFHIAAVRYNPGTAQEVYEQNRVLQEHSTIPMLVAANTEAGGNGACTDGTYIGWQVKVAATQDPELAYQLGRISGIEAAAIGCNWSFAPIVDINRNWRNPIISVRAWGSDPQQVLDYSLAYMRGIRESGIAPAAKHFPGDGIDERDQHLSSAPNWLSTADWDATFGAVYTGLIEAGLPSIMAGHIALPAYQKHFNPAMKDDEILPATLSREIITDLLRGKLGFNGLVVTDASHMVGMTGVMARRDILPTAIEAGCDLFLFFNDPAEDFAWMMQGWKSGKLSDARLHDALRRTLGMKAMLGLHRTAKTEILRPKEEAMAVIGAAEHRAVAQRVADLGITLVKNTQQALPMSPRKYPRVLVVPVGGPPNPMAIGIHGAGAHPADKLTARLRARGYDATRYQTVLDRTKGKSPEEVAAVVMGAYAGKLPISALTDNYDLVLSVGNVNGLMQPVERVSWPATKGTYDIPWYVHEIPTIAISCASPHMLPDIPQVKTYINCYDDKDVTLDVLIDKLEGRSPFKGVPTTDVFAGLADTHC
ncbi:MAG: beta-hexosaminidase [Actinobacteria bacterium]|nr:beta-hexosaminidase [Actinomycetota bacterium]